MTPAERTAKIAELRAEADRLEREERVEVGGLIQEPTSTWIVDDLGGLVKIIGEHAGMRWADWSLDLMPNAKFLGHARDLLTIKAPDAPEPTGAELVGRLCEFSDDGLNWKKGWCARYERGRDTGPYLGELVSRKEWFIRARLYREDRP